MKACINSKELHVMSNEERELLQAHLRMMYTEIDRVCARHGLRMCAGYGTVLGAVRHHGFIPWDDDMDILMPREDYDKLIYDYADELPQNLRIYAPNSSHGPIYRFAKVVDVKTRFISPGATDDDTHGVFIDIFPLEFAPKSKVILKFRNFYTKVLLFISSCAAQNQGKNQFYKRLMCSSIKGRINFRIREFIGLIFSWRQIKEWYNIIANYTYYAKDTNMVNIPTDGGIQKSLIPLSIDCYFPAIKAKFDNIEILIPKEYEDYLVHNYGNWKLIPPIGERWQHFIEKIEL